MPPSSHQEMTPTRALAKRTRATSSGTDPEGGPSRRLRGLNRSRKSFASCSRSRAWNQVLPLPPSIALQRRELAAKEAKKASHAAWNLLFSRMGLATAVPELVALLAVRGMAPDFTNQAPVVAATGDVTDAAELAHASTVTNVVMRNAVSVSVAAMATLVQTWSTAHANPLSAAGLAGGRLRQAAEMRAIGDTFICAMGPCCC